MDAGDTAIGIAILFIQGGDCMVDVYKLSNGLWEFTGFLKEFIYSLFYSFIFAFSKLTRTSYI